jgi:hypothetical protein
MGSIYVQMTKNCRKTLKTLGVIAFFSSKNQKLREIFGENFCSSDFCLVLVSVDLSDQMKMTVLS